MKKLLVVSALLLLTGCAFYPATYADYAYPYPSYSYGYPYGYPYVYAYPSVNLQFSTLHHRHSRHHFVPGRKFHHHGHFRYGRGRGFRR